MRACACAQFADAPFAHVVTALVVDDVSNRHREGEGEGEGEGERDDDDDGIATTSRANVRTWAWTGARDGAIVRWALEVDDDGDALGARQACAGHDDGVEAFARTRRAMVSVDASGGVCAWDRRSGECLHKRFIASGGERVGMVCEREVEFANGVGGVAVVVVAEATRRRRCEVIDPLSDVGVVLEIPQELKKMVEIFVDSSGALGVRDEDGRTHVWSCVGAPAESGDDESSSAPEASAFDLTGWNNIAKPIVQYIGDVRERDVFHHELDTAIGRVCAQGSEDCCVVSSPAGSFSLADRWESSPSNVVVTSCAPAKGARYAPESYVYGYSDGTICSQPLYGSSAPSTSFRGHDGAVLSLLDWTGDKKESFLLSGGKDGTVRAWDYASSKNMAVLRHHQGPVRWLLPAPMSARDASWNNVFITIGDDGVLGLVSADTWAVNFIMPGNGFGVKEMIWNAPRGVLAVLSKDGSLHVWDILTGVLERHLTGGAVQAMMANLREGSFHVVLHGMLGPAQRQWKYTRRRPQPLMWRCVQTNVFAISADINALLDPASNGLPSHGVKRRISLDSIKSSPSVISGSFVDEEVRALHLLLGMLVLSTEGNLDAGIFDEFFANKSRYSDVSVIGAKGSVTFDLPGVRSMKKPSTTRELRLFMAATAIRIVQVSEAVSMAPYVEVMEAVEARNRVVDDADLVFYAWHCMDKVECVRQASKRLLCACLMKSLPPSFELAAPDDLFTCEQFARWDRLTPNSQFGNGLLGLIISSTACLTPNTTVHDSWNIKISRALLEGLKSPSKTVVLTSAALLTEGIKHSNWMSCLADPNKALEEVFELSSKIMSMSTDPTESMINREALSDVLSAFAGASPPFFFTHMNNRLRSLAPEHPAHMLAFMALMRVAQTNVKMLQVHAAYLMDTVMLALNPSNSALRKSCLQGVNVLLTELGKSSSMAFHRETQRFTAAIHGAVKNGTVMIVYDLQTATKWRTLEDNHTDLTDRATSEALATNWSNPLGLLTSPENSVKHSSNVLVDHMRSISMDEYDSGELSVKAVSFDADGNQVAAYLDKLSFVYIWDLTPSWRHTFTRGALPLGTSHYMPCVPSEAPLNDSDLGRSGESVVECSLKFVKSRQIRLVHGEVDMVFSFV